MPRKTNHNTNGIIQKIKSFLKQEMMKQQICENIFTRHIGIYYGSGIIFNKIF